jgi:hypothetical protein
MMLKLDNNGQSLILWQHLSSLDKSCILMQSVPSAISGEEVIERALQRLPSLQKMVCLVSYLELRANLRKDRQH